MSETRLRDNIVVQFSTRLKASFFLFRCHSHVDICSYADILGRSILKVYFSLLFVYLDERNNLCIHIHLNYYPGSSCLHRGIIWSLPDFCSLLKKCNNKSRKAVNTTSKNLSD
jgi:hypothetical protein